MTFRRFWRLLGGSGGFSGGSRGFLEVLEGSFPVRFLESLLEDNQRTFGDSKV